MRARAALAVFLLGLPVPTPSAARPAQSPFCQPASELRGRLEAIDLDSARSCRPGQACYEQKIAEAQRLVDRYPEELHAHRALQDLLRFNARVDEESWKAAQSEYAARALAAPADPVALYLHLRTRPVGEEAAGWTRLRHLDPDFPYAYLGLLEQAPAGERAELLASFIRLCPSRPTDALVRRSLVEEESFWRAHLPRLHQAVAAAPSRERLLAFGPLWSTEFWLAPPALHGGVRERLRVALSELEVLDLAHDELYWAAVTEGYRMLGDEAALARAEAGLRAASPCSLEAATAVIEETVGAPLSGELPEDTLEEVLRASDAWLERCPDSFLFAGTRLAAIEGLADGLSDERLRREAERTLAVWTKSERLIDTFPSPWLRVARLFLARAIDVERVPDLLDREAAYLAGARRRQRLDAAPPALRDRIVRGRMHQDAEIEMVRAEAAIALGQGDAARAGLARAELMLLDLRQATGAEPAPVGQLEATLWRLKGELAAREGHKLDALAFLRQALEIHPSAELEKRTAALWRELGGSESAWAATSGRTSRSMVAAEDLQEWTRVETRFGPFDLVDLDGRPWKAEDLLGRTVLVNIWATWCGPCRLELPHFQRLYERLQARPEVVVLTLNVDQNLGLVLPYLEREGFTFPVLLAQSLLEDLGGEGIPQNWIVDGAGIVRRKQTGFAPQRAAEWVEETLAEVDAVAAGAAREAEP